MRFHFITVPIHGNDTAELELNQFLATHRVIAVDRQLVADGARSAWAICITYVDPNASAPALTGSGTSATDAGKKGRIDYRDVLPEADFQVFAKLRELRKKLAERDGVPPYALFTNEQLAEMVQKRVRTAAELQRIDGVGPARIEKYGRAFLEILTAAPPASPSAVTAANPSAATSVGPAAALATSPSASRS